MERVAEFGWHRGSPPLMDELLVLYDDGTAWLVVRHPRTTSSTIGSFVTTPSPDDRRTMEEAGPGPLELDPIYPPSDPRGAALAAVLERVCGSAREAPLATVSFSVRATRSDPGHAELALYAVAAGERAVQFELNAPAGAVHFHADGQPLSWSEFPELQIGFVTSTAKALGGLRSAAVLEPGAYGAIMIPVVVPDGADAVTIQVAGWLRAALPDHEMPEPFEVRTDHATLVG